MSIAAVSLPFGIITVTTPPPCPLRHHQLYSFMSANNEEPKLFILGLAEPLGHPTSDPEIQSPLGYCFPFTVRIHRLVKLIHSKCSKNTLLNITS